MKVGCKSAAGRSCVGVAPCYSKLVVQLVNNEGATMVCLTELSRSVCMLCKSHVLLVV